MIIIDKYLRAVGHLLSLGYLHQNNKIENDRRECFILMLTVD